MSHHFLSNNGSHDSDNTPEHQGGTESDILDFILNAHGLTREDVDVKKIESCLLSLVDIGAILKKK